MKPGSIVYAVLQEQKHLNLPWYQNIESLLKLDEVFHLDHVTAFKFLHKDNNIDTKASNTTTCSQENSTYLLERFKNHRKIEPLPCKKFRLEVILKNLKDHFKLSWDYEKKKSTKLSLFYDTIKTTFEKEQYLDLVTNASYRFRTSRLRISAHDLEIEHGRYKDIPRDQRLCKWCQLTLNDKRLENERHLLFECDLYATLRSKLIQSIHKSGSKLISYGNISSVNNTSNNLFKDIKLSNLSSYFFQLHSPAIDKDHSNTTTQLESQDEKKNSTDPQVASYISNAISTFIGKCFDKRWAFLKDVKEKNIPLQL